MHLRPRQQRFRASLGEGVHKRREIDAVRIGDEQGTERVEGVSWISELSRPGVKQCENPRSGIPPRAECLLEGRIRLSGPHGDPSGTQQRFCCVTRRHANLVGIETICYKQPTGFPEESVPRVVLFIGLRSADDIRFSIPSKLECSSSDPKEWAWSKVRLMADRVGRHRGFFVLLVRYSRVVQPNGALSRQVPLDLVNRIGEYAIIKLRRAPVAFANAMPLRLMFGSPIAEWLAFID